MKHPLTVFIDEFKEKNLKYINGYKKHTGILRFVAYIGYLGILLVLPTLVFIGVYIDLISGLFFEIVNLKKSKSTKKTAKPQLKNLCVFADNLPISWGKIVKISAADYEDRINELWGAGNYRSAKWNQKLAWLCALSNLGYYLWLKAWKPVSTVFRRLL